MNDPTDELTLEMAMAERPEERRRREGRQVEIWELEQFEAAGDISADDQARLHGLRVEAKVDRALLAGSGQLT